MRFVASFALLLALTPARAEPVDRMLYAVGDRIVTAGDLAFDYDIDPHDRSPIPALEAPDYDRERRLVDLTIVRALAGDTVIYRPTAGEVEARWAAVRASWERPEDFDAFLLRWGMDGEGLRGFLYSRMVVERYIRRVAANADAPVDSLVFVDVYQAWITDLREAAENSTGLRVRRAP